MKALFPVFVYCISLFTSQLLALPVRNRLDIMTRLHQLKKKSTISPDITDRPNTDNAVSIDRTILWRAILSRSPPANPTGNPLHVGQQTEAESTETAKLRSRRHVHLRAHHNHHYGHLMRVGCVLGTCQVQNLGHRLHQLVVQSGREDSPMNLHSPHSYG